MSLAMIIKGVAKTLELRGSASSMTENEFMTNVLNYTGMNVSLQQVRDLYYRLIRDEGLLASAPMVASTENINHWDYYMP